MYVYECIFIRIYIMKNVEVYTIVYIQLKNEHLLSLASIECHLLSCLYILDF